LIDEPERLATINDFVNSIVGTRYALHTGLEYQPGLVFPQYNGVIMGGAHYACPEQSAYALTIIAADGPGAQLTEEQADEAILRMWVERNEGSRWQDLPNDAFSVAEIRQLGDEFCSEFGDNGPDAAVVAVVEPVMLRIPSATETELAQAAYAVSSVGVILLCPEHFDAWTNYLAR